MAASLISLARQRHLRLSQLRDALFLIGLSVALVTQLLQGVAITNHPNDPGAVNTIAVIVVICYLIGIARAWQLIDAPSIGITKEVTELVRHGRTGDESQDSMEPGVPEPGVPEPDAAGQEQGQGKAR